MTTYKQIFIKKIINNFLLINLLCIHTLGLWAQGNTCSNADPIASFPYSNTNQTTCGSTNDYGAQCNSDYGYGEDKVYVLNIASPGTLIIEVNSTTPSAAVGWYLKASADCANDNACLAQAESGTGSLASGWYYFSAAGSYYLLIDSRLPSTCLNYNINISELVAPISNIAVCSGGTADLSSQSAGGVSGCVIQWQQSIDLGANWTDVTGANSANYTTDPLTQTTYYRAVYTCAGLGCNQAVSNVQVVNVQPLPIIVASANSPICAGTDLQLTASGGTDYSWTGPNGFSANVASPSISSIDLNGAGNYTVVVTDANGCSSSSLVSVTVNSSLSVAVSTSSVDCNGNNTGSATANITGGTIPYNYIWSNTATTATINNLTAAVYSVTVTDDNGCVGTAEGTVTEPNMLSATSVIDTEIACFGAAQGAVTVTASGGTAPYNYNWSNGNTTNTLVGVAADTYIATITDANGCTQTVSATLTQPAAIAIVIDQMNEVSCQGGGDGAIAVSVSGGSPTYTYAWSNGATTQDISNLSVGTYTLTVTDSNGCMQTSSATVGEPTTLALAFNITQVRCNGEANGALGAVVTGGTAAYTYAWSNGATSDIIGGLSPNTYTVTVTDANGCTATNSNSISQPTALVITENSIVNAQCDGTPTGAVDVTVTGGSPNYAYNWSSGETTQDLTNVGGGSYTLTVTDANGCTDVFAVIIPFGLNIDVTGGIANIGCEAGNIGSIDVTAAGGTTPFSFVWSNGATTEDLTNIGPGTYTVTITDANGCSASTATTIVGSSPLSLNADVSELACHGDANCTIDISANGGTMPLSFTWNNGENTEDLSSLGAGTYTVTATDANACTAVLTINVTEPPPLAPFVANAANVTCYGANDAFIDIEVNGGTPPYLYLWTTGASTQDLANIGPGDYKVLVTDANGCTKITGVVIKETEPIVITVDSLQMVGCGTGNNGAIYITVDGGDQTNPYIYAWSNGDNTQDISGVGVGTYTVTVTDSAGCTLSGSTDISLSTAPAIQLVSSGCDGTGSGTITVVAVGDNLLYSINGTNFQSSNVFSGLSAATYTVTVLDSQSQCSTTANVTLAAPPSISNLLTACNGGVGTGSIEVSAASNSGGTLAYSLDGINYQTFNLFSGLANGAYTVYVRDNNTQCVTTQTVGVNCSNCSETATANNNGPTCAGSNVTLSANSGGVGYAWNGAAGTFNQQNPLLLNVTAAQAGVYTVTVTYSNGCTATATTNLVVNNTPVITSAVGSCNGVIGLITINATGSNLEYSLNGFTYQSSNVFTNLANNTYTVFVRNSANGCMVMQSGVVVNCGACPGTVTASSNSPVCAGVAISFTATVSGATPLSYSWTGPGGNSTVANPTINNATPAKAGTYTVTVTFGGGCTATATTVVAVNAKPTISNTVKNCNPSGGIITITANSNPSSNGLVYAINGGTFQSSNVFNSLPNGNYTVTVRDVVTGCSTTLSTPININCATTCTATASNNGPVCPGESIQLLANTGGAAYTWNGPSGVSNTQNPVIPNMTPAKVGTYTVTVTYTNGCTATATTTVALKTAPLAAINSDGPTEFCAGVGVTFTVSANGGSPMSYEWSDGNSDNSIFVNQSGTYTVTVTNNQGCTTTATAQATVIACCQADAGTVSVTQDPCPEQPLIATVINNNSSPDYAQYYLLVLDGAVVAVSTDGIIPTVGLNPDDYMLYAYNVLIDPAGGINPPQVGNLVSDLAAGSCAALSSSPVSININQLPVGPTTLVNSEEGVIGIGPFTYNTTILEIEGGTLPYEYTWEINGYVRYEIETNEAGDGVIITVYYSDDADWSVTVADNNGCSDSSLEYDNTPDGENELLDIDTYEITETTDGGASGGVTLNVSGGDFSCGEYQYEWFGPDNWTPVYEPTGGTTYELTDVPVGWYAVTVTDCVGQTTEGWYWVAEGRRGRGKTADIDVLMRAYPNPFDQTTTLSFMLGADTQARMYLYGTDGRIVAELFNNNMAKNVVYELTIDATDLPAGVYYARLVTEQGIVKVEKLVVGK